MRAAIIALSVLVPIGAPAQTYLGPYHPNTYGPGINSDGTGRAFTWQPSPDDGPADLSSPVRPNVFGPGIGMDRYGRPVQPTPYPDGDELNGPVESQGQSHFGAIAFSQRTGAVGYSYDYPSGDEAARGALASCGGDCAVVIWFKNACGALAVGTGNAYGANWGNGEVDAESGAMNTCNSNGSNCSVVRWVCTSR